MADDEPPLDEDVVSWLKRMIGPEYPPEKKTASKAEFVTGIRKIRKPISPLLFWTGSILYCLLFWAVISWLLSLVF